MSNGYSVKVKSNRPLVRAILAVAEAVTEVGGNIVARIDDLRTEIARGNENLGTLGANLVQQGVDLNELLDRIATAAEAGDPVDADIAAARAIADGVGAAGQTVADTNVQIDAILAEAPPVNP